MRLEPGAEFAGFTIGRVLGNGGMGVVYLARNPRLDRLVALKVLGDLIAADPRGRARFEREAALAARLEHPNIVAIYDRADSEAESPWISMKYVSGGDVAQQMGERGGPLTPDEAVRILTDAARGLDYAHQHGVLHRDVKPGNILLDRTTHDRDRALLTDFGIARALDDTLTLTGTAATFGYAAPERFHGTAADHRADIYSLGCTLYELLTARQPFPRTDQAAVLAAHLSAPPPRPTDLRPDLPPGWNDVIAIAMAKNPDDRYPTCGALAEAAARITTGPRVRFGNLRTATTLEAPPDPTDTQRTPPPADSTEWAEMAGLPDSIRAALDSPHPEIRLGAVHTLGTQLASSARDRSESARKALRYIATHDSPAVASAAREILGGASTMDSPRIPRASHGSPQAGNPVTAPPDHPPAGGRRITADGLLDAVPAPVESPKLAAIAGLLAMAAGLLHLLGPHPVQEIPDFATFLDQLSIIAICAGATTFVPALRRRFGPALVAGVALTGVWGTVGLLARLMYLVKNKYSVDPKSHALALSMTGILVLAGVCAAVALLHGTTGKPGFRAPRSPFAITTVTLGALAAVLTSLGIAHFWGWQAYFGGNYFPLWVIPPVILTAAPVLLATLTPRPVFTAVTVGWAFGVYALGSVGSPNGEVPDEAPAGLFSGGPANLLFLLIPGAVAIVNIFAFRAEVQE